MRLTVNISCKFNFYSWTHCAKTGKTLVFAFKSLVLGNTTVENNELREAIFCCQNYDWT